jgi:hypothetical protein
MSKSLATASFALVLAGAVQAQDAPQITPGTFGLSADGTWDCNDSSGTYLGAIVLAELSYAFIDPDGKAGTYGKLNKDDWLDAPGFFVLSGELKDRFGAISLLMIGPELRPNDFADWGKLRLKVVVTPDTLYYCSRRNNPAI